MQRFMAPLVFFDLRYTQESKGENSKSNQEEVDFIQALILEVINLVKRNTSRFPDKVRSDDEKIAFILNDLKARIGIISPYKQQVHRLRQAIFSKLRTMNAPYDMLEINTVDAYQGKEMDIIIISCVRSSQEK